MRFSKPTVAVRRVALPILLLINIGIGGCGHSDGWCESLSLGDKCFCSIEREPIADDTIEECAVGHDCCVLVDLTLSRFGDDVVCQCTSLPTGYGEYYAETCNEFAASIGKLSAYEPQVVENCSSDMVRAAARERGVIRD
jgi:hypothetical protein